MAEAETALVVFADDWGRHPSSCQHLVRQLLPRRRAVWVNTIGTRRPALNLLTLRRGLEKAAQWLAPRRSAAGLPDNLTVLNPRMWPWFSSRFDRRINGRLLARQVAPEVKRLDRPVVGVTTLPITADVMGRLPIDRWVYYCVDDFGEWPGLDGRALRAMEADVVRQADVLVAVSQPLRAKLAAGGRAVHLLPHGVDLAHWQGKGRGDVPATLQACGRPLVLFWGLVDRRLDVELLRATAAAMVQGTIALVGPENEPDPALAGVPRLVRVPSVPYDMLPAVARVADVLVMPYADLPVTRAMQPLKLLEYLATGKPAVVRDLPSTRDWADCLDVAATAERFAALVRERLAVGLPPAQRAARERLVHESWGAKAVQFEGLLVVPRGSRPNHQTLASTATLA